MKVAGLEGEKAGWSVYMVRSERRAEARQL